MMGLEKLLSNLKKGIKNKAAILTTAATIGLASIGLAAGSEAKKVFFSKSFYAKNYTDSTLTGFAGTEDAEENKVPISIVVSKEEKKNYNLLILEINTPDSNKKLKQGNLFWNIDKSSSIFLVYDKEIDIGKGIRQEGCKVDSDYGTETEVPCTIEGLMPFEKAAYAKAFMDYGNFIVDRAGDVVTFMVTGLPIPIGNFIKKECLEKIAENVSDIKNVKRDESLDYMATNFEIANIPIQVLNEIPPKAIATLKIEIPIVERSDKPEKNDVYVILNLVTNRNRINATEIAELENTIHFNLKEPLKKIGNEEIRRYIEEKNGKIKKFFLEGYHPEESNRDAFVVKEKNLDDMAENEKICYAITEKLDEYSGLPHSIVHFLVFPAYSKEIKPFFEFNEEYSFQSHVQNVEMMIADFNDDLRKDIIVKDSAWGAGGSGSPNGFLFENYILYLNKGDKFQKIGIRDLSYGILSYDRKDLRFKDEANRLFFQGFKEKDTEMIKKALIKEMKFRAKYHEKEYIEYLNN